MNRRRYLTLAGAGVVGSLAGCGGSSGSGPNGSNGGQSIDDHPAAANLEAQPRQGDLGGNVVLAFEDPSCTQCRRFHENAVPKIEENIVDAGEGAYVVRTYPIIYPWGKPATQALESAFARSEGAFWALFNHYFAEQGQFNDDNVLDRTEQFLTNSTDIDGSSVVADARNEAHDDAVQADITAAEDAELPQQTPIVLLFRDGQFATRANGSVSYDLIANALEVN
ncbi:DsbA family protein [Haloarcula salinisoli]|uniref:DsbA family protein n=1 Tax=Haloarcula salinisoli TaxID=2487746 RepID=A0A8J7YK06_9EURY|nr:thioredoxin domain-containing protein [Halomicroarcula salinisoli]MBX0287787.1 DsbA family protein [Halomicroarcula salinisoli]MBX0304711.1 DsbA family protein [Halomicroarcula salinisoli]